MSGQSRPAQLTLGLAVALAVVDVAAKPVTEQQMPSLPIATSGTHVNVHVELGCAQHPVTGLADAQAVTGAFKRRQIRRPRALRHGRR